MRSSAAPPTEKFLRWLEEAKAHPAIADATAMSLATAGRGGTPSSRIVLLKHVDARGFTFFTSLLGRKSEQLAENPQAALCFHWAPLERQVRIEGGAEPVSDAEADAYFASRPRESQIGAWASQQSQPLASREALLERFRHFEALHAGKTVPRPPYWTGWRVLPQRIEFWQSGPHRLHTRELYTREGYGWALTLLNP
jgi:pyridoxamine 5'-phosphate oxidase